MAVDFDREQYRRFVRERLAMVQTRMAQALKRAGDADRQVKLIAVTKYVDEHRLPLLCEAGIEDCGENRWQVAKPKVESGLPMRWHFIGPLQTNKVRFAVRHFAYIHSVDRLALAQEVDRQAALVERRMPILLQVNVACEPQKSGAHPSTLRALAEHCLSLRHLELGGLMMIGTHADNPVTAREEFRALRRLRDELAQSLGHALPELSMGMSNDFPVAIEEGATMVRIGRLLVVEENPRISGDNGVSYY